jgi:alkylation response protein AidB-like acyl-CoA dehydrogenase
MDFEIEYSPAQQAFRAQVSLWLDENVPDGLSARTRSRDESAVKYRQRRELGRLLGERGWLYPAAPKEYGGGGLDADSSLVLEEEVHKRGLGLPPYYDSGGKYGSATILVWGTDEQKVALLPPIFNGVVRTWQLLSEPAAGSDLANVRTTAVRVGDDYVLNGQKVYVGSDHGADRLWVIAMTGDAQDRHQNLSWFMVDADSAGIQVQPQYLMSTVGEGDGDVGHKNTVYFTDVHVPADRLVGGENNGWKVASTHLELEHGAMATVGRDRFLQRLVDLYVREGRSAFLVDDPEILDTLADVYVTSELNRLLAVRNFWMRASKIRTSYEGSQAMYLKKVSGLWLTRAVAEILGPAALTNDDIHGALDGSAEEQQREGIVDMHPGATGEIHKLIIARRLGLGSRVAETAGTLH